MDLDVGNVGYLNEEKIVGAEILRLSTVCRSETDGVLVNGGVVCRKLNLTEACFQNIVLKNFIPHDSTVLERVLWNRNKNCRGNGRKNEEENMYFKHQHMSQFIGKPRSNILV